jgi:hypothetical protein
VADLRHSALSEGNSNEGKKPPFHLHITAHDVEFRDPKVSPVDACCPNEEDCHEEVSNSSGDNGSDGGGRQRVPQQRQQLLEQRRLVR